MKTPVKILGARVQETETENMKGPKYSAIPHLVSFWLIATTAAAPIASGAKRAKVSASVFDAKTYTTCQDAPTPGFPKSCTVDYDAMRVAIDEVAPGEGTRLSDELRRNAKGSEADLNRLQASLDGVKSSGKYRITDGKGLSNGSMAAIGVGAAVAVGTAIGLGVANSKQKKKGEATYGCPSGYKLKKRFLAKVSNASAWFCVGRCADSIHVTVDGKDFVIHGGKKKFLSKNCKFSFGSLSGGESAVTEE